MRPALVPVLAIALCAAPLSAQKMGSTNSKAPTITQSIEFPGSAKIKLVYTSITWAEGKTMKAVADPEQGARTREFVNRMAERAPLGTLVTSDDLVIGGKTVAAGEYKLYFTIDDNLAWHLVLAGAEDGGDKFDWKLDLAEQKSHSNRLCVNLGAGDKDGTGTLEIAFGKMGCAIPVGGEPAAEKGADKKGAK